MFVRHDSDEEVSPLRPDEPGNAFKPEVSGEPDLLVTKQVNSAFYGSPDLDAWLRERGISSFALCGITTNHCVETTAAWAATSATTCCSCSTPARRSTARGRTARS